MKHIEIISAKPAVNSVADGGCGQCRTSCQSACKTSCTVANQPCENAARVSYAPGKSYSGGGAF